MRGVGLAILAGAGVIECAIRGTKLDGLSAFLIMVAFICIAIGW